MTKVFLVHSHYSDSNPEICIHHVAFNSAHFFESDICYHLAVHETISDFYLLFVYYLYCFDFVLARTRNCEPVLSPKTIFSSIRSTSSKLLLAELTA